MPWNECLYQYHKKYGGQLLAGKEEDGLLVFSRNDRPLIVDLFRESGRYSPFFHVQARISVTLAKPYELTIGAEKALSGGVNAVLKAVPGLPGGSFLPADFGYPEITKKRLIRTDNRPFTKLVLGNPELRGALAACPQDKVEVRPGPGEEGLHLITVTTAAELGRSDWYTGEYLYSFSTQEEKAEAARRVEEEFFPRMDRFLDLARAACGAVTQWPM